MKTNPMKMQALFVIAMTLLAAMNCSAVSYTLTNSGAWNVSANWNPNGVPTTTDTAIVATGKSITGLGGTSPTVTTLTIQGTGTVTVDAGTLTLSSATAGLTVGSSGAANLTISSGATLAITGTGGTVWGFGGTGSSITNNGTLTCAGGNGSTSGNFVNNGTATFTGSQQSFNNSGNIIQGTNAVLNINSSSGTPFGASPTLTFNTSGNTVSYGGTTPNIKGAIYNNLTIATSGNPGNGGALTVNGTLTIATTTAATLNIGALTMGNNSTIIRTLGTLNVTPTFPGSPNFVSVIYANTNAMTTGNELPANIKNLTLTNTTSSANKVTLNTSTTVNGTLAVTYLTTPTTSSGATVLTAASGKTLTFSTSPVTINLPGSTITGGGSPYTVVSGGSTFVSGSLGTVTVQGAGAPASSSVVVNGGQLLLGVGPTIYGAATTTAFTTTYGAASTSQSFAISGVNLTADVVATAGTGFEVSSDNVTYGATTNYTQSGGNASGTVYVRLKATAAVSGSYNSANAVVLSSTGANNANITTPASGNSVTARALGITASNVNKTYGQALTGGAGSTAFTSSGLQNGETIGSVTIAYGTGSAANASVASSPYTAQVTPSAATGGTFTAGNYTITYNKGNIIVGQASLSVTASNANKTYGQALTGGAGSTAFTSSGLQNGETIGSVTIAYGTGSAANASVASSPYTGSVTPSAATGGTFTAGNYSITYNTGNIIVGAANLTVTASNVNKTYGQTLTGGSGSAAFGSSGLQNGETIGSVTIAYGTGSAASDSVAGSPYTGSVTASAATGGTFTLGNYNITYNSGNIIVGNATATVVVTPYTVTYDGNPHTATVTSITGVNGETDATVGTVDVSGTTHTNAGTYATDSWSFTGAANYNNIGATTITNTINQATASVTADAKTKIYGDTNPTLTAVTNGAVNGDVINVTLTTDATQFSSVGVSNIFVAAGSNPNYTVLTTNSTLTINPKEASVTADSKTKIYGDVNPVLTAVTNGAVNGDVIDVTLTTDATQFSGVGISNITVTAGSNPNYIVSTTNSTLTINPKEASVTADSQTKIYGGVNPAMTAVTNGAVNGDVIDVMLTTDATQFSSVGVSNIFVVAGSNPNYTVLTTNSTLTISPKDASVTADAQTKTYGEVNPVLTGVTNGTVNGDILNVTLTTDVTQFSSVGVSNITVTAGGNPNYSVFTTNSTLTIGTRPITVTAQTNTKDYDGNTSATNVPSLTSGTLASSDGFATLLEVYADAAVGTGKTLIPSATVTNSASADVTANYAITFVNDLTGVINSGCSAPVIVGGIDPGGLTVTVGSQVVLTITNVTGSSPLAYQWLSNSVVIADATNSSYTNFSVTLADAGNYQVVVTNACGSVTSSIAVLNVYNVAGPAQISIPTNGVVNISFYGVPNNVYVVQTTTNLSAPWWPLITNTASLDGSWLFTDSNATNAQQYYRITQP